MYFLSSACFPSQEKCLQRESSKDFEHLDGISISFDDWLMVKCSDHNNKLKPEYGIAEPKQGWNKKQRGHRAWVNWGRGRRHRNHHHLTAWLFHVSFENIETIEWKVKYQAQMGGRGWDNVWHRWRSDNCSEYHWRGFGVSMVFNIRFPYSFHQNHHPYENSSSYSIFDIKCTTNICT